MIACDGWLSSLPWRWQSNLIQLLQIINASQAGGSHSVANQLIRSFDNQHMEVSWNGATPKSSNFFIRMFHYKHLQTIQLLGYLHLWKPPNPLIRGPSSQRPWDRATATPFLLGFDDGHLFLRNRSWQKCQTYKEGSNELKVKLLAIHRDSLYLSIPIKSSFDTFFV